MLIVDDGFGWRNLLLTLVFCFLSGTCRLYSLSPGVCCLDRCQPSLLSKYQKCQNNWATKAISLLDTYNYFVIECQRAR